MPNYFASYGTFRLEARLPETPTLRAFKHLGPCLIPGRLYQMGGYPALKPGNGRVKGELIELPWQFDFAAFDHYEDYYPARPQACRYFRRRIRLIEPAVEAWVYVYGWPVDPSTRIISGDWLAAIAAGVRVRRFRGDRLPGANYRPKPGCSLANGRWRSLP